MKIPRKTSSIDRVPFNQFELSNLLSITMLKTAPTGNTSCEFFKVARRASLEGLRFSNVIGEISTLHNSVGNSIGVFGKVVLLEIARSLQFATLLKTKHKPNFLNVQTGNAVLS